MAFTLLRASPCRGQNARYVLEYTADASCPAQPQFESLVDYYLERQAPTPGAHVRVSVRVDRLERREYHEPSSPAAPAVSTSAPLGTGSAAPQAAAIVSVEPSVVAPPRAHPAVTSPPRNSDESELRAPREATRNFEAPSVEQLSRELATLRGARSALAGGNAAQARLLLNRYRSDFPAGVLATEAAALEVETAEALGDSARAAALATVFLRDHPTSPLSARVRAVLEASAKP